MHSNINLILRTNIFSLAELARIIMTVKNNLADPDLIENLEFPKVEKNELKKLVIFSVKNFKLQNVYTLHTRIN